MNREVIIALTAATVLTVAAVGFIVYQNDGAAASTVGTAGLGVPDLATLAGPTVTGATELGASTDEVVVLNQTGLVNVTFTLRWSATNGADSLRLSVAPSEATGLTEGAASEAESDGEITLTFSVPNAAADGAFGVGEWQATVEFVEASTGLPAEPPVAPPGTTDASVEWTLETSLQAHAAAVAS